MEETDRRRRLEDADGGDVNDANALVVTDLVPTASEALDPRRTLRTLRDEAGRALMTDGGRDGVARPDVIYDGGAGVSIDPGVECPGEERDVSPCTSTRGVSETLRRP